MLVCAFRPKTPRTHQRNRATTLVVVDGAAAAAAVVGAEACRIFLTGCNNASTKTTLASTYIYRSQRLRPPTRCGQASAHAATPCAFIHACVPCQRLHSAIQLNFLADAELAVVVVLVAATAVAVIPVTPAIL